MRTVCTSGYFNPIHSGHIALLKQAKEFGDRLIVIVNNDKQVKLKGSVPFMSAEERAYIVSNIKGVNRVIIATDTTRSIKETLKAVRPDVFVKGGDSTPENTPELELCQELGIEVHFGVGGGKTQSSSWLLSKV